MQKEAKVVSFGSLFTWFVMLLCIVVAITCISVYTHTRDRQIFLNDLYGRNRQQIEAISFSSSSASFKISRNDVLAEFAGVLLQYSAQPKAEGAKVALSITVNGACNVFDAYIIVQEKLIIVDIVLNENLLGDNNIARVYVDSKSVLYSSLFSLVN